MKNNLAISLSALSLLISVVVLSYAFVEKKETSTVELLNAMGVIRITVKIPNDLEKDEFLGTAWFDGIKFVSHDNNIQGFPPGSLAVIYLWTHNNDEIHHKLSILNKNFDDESLSAGYTELNPPNGFNRLAQFVQTGTQLTEGDGVLKFKNSEDEERILKIVRKKLPDTLIYPINIPPTNNFW